MEYIAFDAHKHYTLASVAGPDGQLVREEGIEHDRGSLREFVERCERGSAVASRRSATGIGLSMSSRPRAVIPNSCTPARRVEIQ